jgi:tetratricopeptide (TPR) repeat protein
MICIATSYQQAIAENNSAVTLFESGNYRLAIVSFSNALQIFKTIMDRPPVEHHEQSLKTTLDQCMARRRNIHGIGSEVDESSEHFMYRQAIHVPVEIDCSFRASALISTMIIFNLALAHQLLAATHDKKEQLLSKAAKLYEYGFNLQRAEDFESNVLFTLATVNNLGLIHQQLNASDQAKNCFEHLLSSMMYLIDCGEGHGFEFDGFLRNVSAMISQPSSAAAA